MLQEHLELSVPRDRVITWKSPELKPTISESGNYRVYTWSRSNLETRTPNEKVEVAKLTWERGRGRFPQPDVRLSSFQTWGDIGRWYGNLQNDRVKPTLEIQAKAAELTKGMTDDDAKLRAIYNYVSLQFRYIGIAFGVGRYQPHFAAEVLANQYGDCKDKHTLFAALLSAAGIKAYPALINSQREMDEDMPSPSAFDHVMTVIPRGNTLIWLDTTAEVAPFQYLQAPLRDKHALVLWDDKPAALLNTPADLPYPSFEKFKMKAALDDSGTLTGDSQFFIRGDTEVLLRSAFRSTAMPQWKELAQRISQSLGFAGEVSDVSASSPEKTDEPFRLSYKYHRKDFGDWPNHRIVAPSAFISLPTMSSDLDALSVPFFLGELLEVSFEAQLELPKGYIPQVPEDIHVKNDFAKFDATYSFKGNTLSSERSLRTLLHELPKSDFTPYEQFSKTVFDDYSQWIQLSSNRTPTPDAGAQSELVVTDLTGFVRHLPDSSAPEALRLETEANEALQRKDSQTAIASLYRSVAADPKFIRAWLRLGAFLMSVGQWEAGIDAFKKATAANPQEPVSYKVYAYASMAKGNYNEALPVWQSYVKFQPDDPDGPMNLGNIFIWLKRYPEATKELETVLKLRPSFEPAQSQLAKAYLLAGDVEQARDAYHALLELGLPAESLNQAAFDIAETNKGLDIALEFARKAVESVEDDSTKITLDNPLPEDEALALKLSNYWHTLGWIQLRLGKLEDAEKTLVASWKLTQNGMAAAHLCELYQSQHNMQSALQMCRFAHNRLSGQYDPDGNHITNLAEKNNARLEQLSPGSSKTVNMNAIDEIIAMRDYKLPHVNAASLTAVHGGSLNIEYYVLLELDPNTGRFHAIGQKRFSGTDALKPLAPELLKINFKFTSPDSNPVRVLRRGNFLCITSVGCEFILHDSTTIGLRTIELKVAH